MAMGRCAGCGKTDNSCKVINKHCASCPDYIALYKSDPSKCLEPAKEYVRWRANEGSDDNVADAKDDARGIRIAGLRANDAARRDRYDTSFDVHHETAGGGNSGKAPKLHERHITSNVPGLDLSALV